MRELRAIDASEKSWAAGSGQARRWIIALSLALCWVPAPLLATDQAVELEASRGQEPEASQEQEPGASRGQESEAGGDQEPEASEEQEGAETDREPLSPEHQAWLESVELLITKEEHAAFLELAKTYQRDAFIRRFWKERDPYPDTSRNELRERWEARQEYVRQNFGRFDDDRARVVLLNGEPPNRIKIRCPSKFNPLEVWFYPNGSEQWRNRFALIFYQTWTRGGFRAWHPGEGMDELSSFAGGNIAEGTCLNERAIWTAIAWMKDRDPIGFEYMTLLATVSEAPRQRSGEWVETFHSYTTEIPPGAETFEASLAVDFPGWHQSRTVVQATIQVAVEELARAEIAGHTSFNLQLTGEVLQNDELFDSFRYRFDPPGNAFAPGGSLPLVFQRYLRPGGPYRMVLKLEDLNQGAYYRVEHELEVPRVTVNELPPPQDPVLAQVLAEANAALAAGETVIKVIPPMGELFSGMVRFQTIITGEGVRKVTFSMDGEKVLTKTRPPYSVELDLGPMPRSQVLRAAAYDDAGNEIASDEFLVNSGGANRFRVRLIEPERGKSYLSSLRARVEVQVPEGDAVQRVELYVNESLEATLYQPPWVQPMLLPQGTDLAYVRAVAVLTDGNSTEDVVFVNAPDYVDDVDVQLVELYASVLGDRGRPVEGLTMADFRVEEDGVEQSIARFEQVRDRPVHAAILLDVSNSMTENLPAARDAALTFFEQTIETKDRAALITFNDRPYLATQFTNDVSEFGAGLAGLKAERGTALYDSMVYSLFFFSGVTGQRAIVILSDGEDQNSRFTFEETLEYARRAGITVYAVGLALPKRSSDAKRKLSKLADETGGRSFFIDSVAELSRVYGTIERDLRSQYLVAYQSSNVSGSRRFRTVELEVERRGVEVRTLRGYYP